MIVDKTGSEQKTKTLLWKFLRRWKVLLMKLNLFAFYERICHFKSSRVERLNGESWQNDKDEARKNHNI